MTIPTSLIEREQRFNSLARKNGLCAGCGNPLRADRVTCRTMARTNCSTVEQPHTLTHWFGGQREEHRP